jgi:hypothetical protein
MTHANSKGGFDMNAVEIQAHARKLFDVHGTKALAEAAQKVHQLEQQGETQSAKDWRRIQAVMQELHGPSVS